MKTIKLRNTKERLYNSDLTNEWSAPTWHEVFEMIDRPAIWDGILHDWDEDIPEGFEKSDFKIFEEMSEDEVKEELMNIYGRTAVEFRGDYDCITDPADMLEEARDTLYLKQKDLGVYIGVSTRTVNSWFTGERQCPSHVAEMALRLAKADAEALECAEPTTGMYRWAVVHEDLFEEFLTVCGSKADALREGENGWNHMTTYEKERCKRYEVALIHVSINEWRAGIHQFDRFSYYANEYGEIDGSTYDSAKKWL